MYSPIGSGDILIGYQDILPWKIPIWTWLKNILSLFVPWNLWAAPLAAAHWTMSKWKDTQSLMNRSVVGTSSSITWQTAGDFLHGLLISWHLWELSWTVLPNWVVKKKFRKSWKLGTGSTIELSQPFSNPINWQEDQVWIPDAGPKPLWDGFMVSGLKMPTKLISSNKVQ